MTKPIVCERELLRRTRLLRFSAAEIETILEELRALIEMLPDSPAAEMAAALASNTIGEVLEEALERAREDLSKIGFQSLDKRRPPN